MGFVYCVRNTKTDERYVGQTSFDDLDQRITAHVKGSKSGHCSLICDAIRQYDRTTTSITVKLGRLRKLRGTPATRKRNWCE